MHEDYSEYLLDQKQKNRASIITTYILMFILAAYIVAFYFLSVIPIDGQSMENTIADNRYCLVLKRCFTVNRGDIVTINTSKDKNKEHIIIKRVIALGGDRLIFMDTQDKKNVDIYICKKGESYFKLLKEPYLKEKMSAAITYQTIQKIDYRTNLTQINVNSTEYTSELFLKTVTVPKNHVFFLGDNRNISRDSRYYGTVHINNIKAKYLLTL